MTKINAVKQGNKEMNICKQSLKPKAFEFINGKYAENGKIKVYSNKKQVNTKIDKLLDMGIICEASVSWPYLILEN